MSPHGLSESEGPGNAGLHCALNASPILTLCLWAGPEPWAPAFSSVRQGNKVTTSRACRRMETERQGPGAQGRSGVGDSPVVQWLRLSTSTVGAGVQSPVK